VEIGRLIGIAQSGCSRGEGEKQIARASASLA
jgi:hypothetical protein